jgi:peroxiredoxin
MILWHRLQKNRFKKHLKQIKDEYAYLQRGNPSPEFSLPDKDGKMINLSDFRGKIVYLDFWTSWCQPCLSEVEPAREKKYLEGKEIVFVYVSLDEKQEKSLEAALKFNIEGVHLWGGELSRSIIAQKYKLTRVPTYVVIGKDGNILSYNGTRPSRKGTREFLESKLRK